MGDKYKATTQHERELLELCGQDISNFKHEKLLGLVTCSDVRIDATDNNGMTALMHAAYKGNLTAVRALLDEGADVNCNLHEHFYTALMFATMSGSIPTVNVLLEHGAKPHATNKHGRTAAQVGAFIGQNSCVSAINNFISIKDLEEYAKPQGTEKLPKLPSSAVPVVHSLLTVLNIHPVHIRQVILNDLSSCQYHTRVTTTLEALSAKMVKQMNEAMSLKAHYISYILRGVILEGQTLLEKCLVQQLPDGKYVERDIFLRKFLKEYPHIQNPVWKQLVATAAKAPVAGPPSVLSLLNSVILGRKSDKEEDEECETCGDSGDQLQKCAGCKMVFYCNTTCQKMAWESGSHRKMCRILKKQSESNKTVKTPINAGQDVSH